MSDFDFEEEEFNTQFNGQTVLRIFKLGMRHWKLMIGFLTGIAVVSVIEAYLTYLGKRIIDEGILANDFEATKAIIMQYAALWLVFAVFVFMFIACAGVLGHVTQYDLRTILFDHLQKLPLSYYDRTPTGWLQARVTSDATRVGDLVSWGFLDMFWGFTSVVVSLCFMFYIDWRLTFVVIALIPVMTYVAIKFKRRILGEYRVVRKVNSKITNAYSESISGVRVVKALGREKANLDAFSELSAEMYKSSYRASWLSALFLPAVQLIGAIGVGVIIWAGGWQVNNGTFTVGGIQAFVGYITFMLWPILELARVYATMQQAIASAERIFSLIDTPPTIVDTPNAIEPTDVRGDIVFDNVSFQYETGKPVLKNFTLHVKQGETIALVGPTGAGKSTIVNLLGRFYEPTDGAITINGTNYRDLTSHGLQSRLGMVLQTPHLFSGTIMENLRYGRLNATDEEVLEAAKLAGADTFINNLDDDYATTVGEGGALLSVGQKQLISLARAILAQPDIFIMDEATSSVDTLTEALIQRGMDRLMRDRTSFVIAHRLSTIKNADRILVIDDGAIAELGSHSELIRARGHYYELYTKQFRREREQQASATVTPSLAI